MTPRPEVLKRCPIALLLGDRLCAPGFIQVTSKVMLVVYEYGNRCLMQEEQPHAEAPGPHQSSPACCLSESLANPPSALARQALCLLTPVRMSTAQTSCCLHLYLSGEWETLIACRFDRSIFEVILGRPDRQIVSLS
jgi:hypothetical protein